MVSRRQLLKLSALGTASFAAPLAYSASNITMTHNTGNPIGSTSPKDLSDNTRNLDLLSLGPNPSYPDRLGVSRKSWRGMELDFNSEQSLRESKFDADQAARIVGFDAFLENSGFETPVDYVAGFGITRATQIIRFDAELYRARNASIPFTTSSWALDQNKFLAIGDAVLRQELANSDGAKRVGGVTVNLDALADLQLLHGRCHGDIASISSVGASWALSATYPFPCGGGEFVWDASSVETPIYGMLVEVVGASMGRWKRKYCGPVHVTWTGAIPDGVTKCSVAVQLALDHFPAVYFPPGEFVLDRANSHGLVYTSDEVDCGVKITSDQKCMELYGAGEATLLLSEPGVRYIALISMYNVMDRSVHSLNIDGRYDRTGRAFKGAITGIRQQSVRRCTTHSLKISNFAFHCLAMYGGSSAEAEPACLWNKAYDLFLDGGGQSSLLVFSAEWNGLPLPNEYNEFNNIYAMNSHVYFGVEIRRSNYNTFTNLVTSSNAKGGLNLEEGASFNNIVNWVSRFNKYGLHITGNGSADVTGNRISNFDVSENSSHNVLAYQGAVGNYFAQGRLCSSGHGNGWRSEDSSSHSNFFRDLVCQDNFGDGFLFQNTENITDVLITGNGSRGLTAYGESKLRRVTSRDNGTDVLAQHGTLTDAVDCDFGPRHAVIPKDALRVGQVIEAGKAGRYNSGGGSIIEVIVPGSMSSVVWKTTMQYDTLICIPVGFFWGSGLTSLKLMMRMQTDGGVSRSLRDISADININIPANTGWVWVVYTLALSELNAASEIKIRYELASGYVLLDGYQLVLM